MQLSHPTNIAKKAISSVLPLGITMGCPASIGPEIIIKYFHYSQQQPQSIVLGDINILRKAALLLEIEIEINPWLPGMLPHPKGISVLNLSNISPTEHRWGAANELCGKAMADYILKGVDLSQQHILAGIVTCPISKVSLNKAGYHYPGHTEMLAALSNSSEVVMMMAGKTLKVTLVTVHCPLAEVADLLSIEKIIKLIEITYKSLKNDFGIVDPRIAVAGLNPHSGEDTLFGFEEVKIIGPAVMKAQKRGFNVQGPFPPDTVFYKAATGSYDAVVCMYHDQGLIPFKLLHFEDGVNVTLGLPFVRTSVDHGTAYDIAGTGVAHYDSLEAAVHLAFQIHSNRQAISITQN